MPQRLKDELGTQEPALPGNALNWIGGRPVSPPPLHSIQTDAAP